jgi:hypothetical protein
LRSAKEYLGWEITKVEPLDRERVAVSVFLKRLSVFRADGAYWRA